MASYTQTGRPLQVTTALGKDALLLVGFSGTEQVSQLFHFSLEMLAERDQDVPFDKLLGQPVIISVELLSGSGRQRHFHGIISRVMQGVRDQDFTRYSAEVVPQLWLLTKRTQSRIFQQTNVPDILKQVLAGLKIDWKLRGTYEPRDYCVQYRESDFDFASRLMEEEGIYYFFTHAPDGHTLVISDAPLDHPDVPLEANLLYEQVLGGNRPEARIIEWEKYQEIRSGKTTLWDHSFELPHKHLEAEKTIMDSAAVGTVTHKLKLPGVDKLELYDFPGEYAQRFDGIAPGGGDRAADVQKIFQDNARTAGIRMQQEAMPALRINGGGSCSQLTAGHKFTLDRHFDANGPYLVLHVSHSARLELGYRSGGGGFFYQNSFQCLPAAVPFRPARLTRRPTVAGSQTAVVVGPPGEEIFTDKYGRVKVQFHWDRQGKNNADSSCWIRVATLWAGKNWGMIHIPRIGQEVIVDFLEGDPDQPIIVGSVYNADQMPPWALPGNKTQSGIQTRSSLGGTPANFNQIRFEDKKGSEQVHIHAEKNQDIGVENDESHWVGHDRTKTIDHDETTHVKHDRTETVDNNETITIHGNRTETVDKNETITIHGNRVETVDLNESITVTGNRTRLVALAEAVTVGAAQAVTVGGPRAVTVGAAQAITVGASQTTTVGKDDTATIGGNRAETVAKDKSSAIAGGRKTSVTKDDALAVGKNLAIEAGESIVLKTGDASITMKKDGTIIIKGKDITVEGSGQINAKADKNIIMKGQKILQN
jgi:type VI secretion system secreted protein VgrG